MPNQMETLTLKTQCQVETDTGTLEVRKMKE